MAMLGKRFQRTISMSQIGPGSNLHAEKAQAQNYYQQQQQQKEGELVGEQNPANQWDILKNAEAMMMMMMTSNSGGNAISEESPLLLMAAAATKNEQVPPPASPHTGTYPCSPAVPAAVCAPANHMMSSSTATLVVPTHHFLDACFYCKRRLRPERDIFIYRGDAAFCTEECRHRQILNDETHSRASKKRGGASSETAVAA